MLLTRIHVKVDDIKEFHPDKNNHAELLVNSEKLVSMVVCFDEGQSSRSHAHKTQDEIFFVVEGTGVIAVGEEEIPVGPTSVVYAPAGVVHQVRTAEGSRLVIVLVKAPR